MSGGNGVSFSSATTTEHTNVGLELEEVLLSNPPSSTDCVEAQHDDDRNMTPSPSTDVGSDVDSLRSIKSSPLPMQTSGASSRSNRRCPITATAIPGTLNAHNDGAIDWGWQSCLAYGCQSLVVVILDVRFMAKVHILDQHKYLVSQVKWSRENYYHGPRQSYNLRLASADMHGRIIVWDVAKGAAQSSFADSESPICDMAWHWHQDASYDMLLVLHPSSTFILWNASTGTMIWRKTYSRMDQLESFDCDPHQPKRILFIAMDGLWLQDDLTLFKPPNGDLQKISWQNGKSEASSHGQFVKDSSQSPPTSLRADVRQRAARLLNRRSLTPNGVNPDDSNFLIEVFFHRSLNDVLIAVYPRRILLISLRYSSVFRVISTEKSAAPIVAVLPLRQLDAFYCLHANGCISFRYMSKSKSLKADSKLNSYDVVHQQDATRLFKQSKVYGFVLDPITELQVSVLLNDGRIFMWNLDSPDIGLLQLAPAHFSHIPKLLLTYATTPVHAPPLVLQAAPAHRHHSEHREQLLAVGSSKGTVQLYNLSTTQLLREFFIQTTPVQGVEWVTDLELLVFSYPHPSTPAALVRSEISLLDRCTGEVRLLRRSQAEESPIRGLKVSPCKDHFVIIFKNGAPEVWSIVDGRHLTWHRPRSVPHATAAEWVVVGDVSVKSQSPTSTVTPVVRRELLLFVDLNGLFQAFRVKGNIVHEDRSSVFATQTTIGHVTAMCRRKDKIVMGDVDGSLIKWIPPETLAETKNLNRGWIKQIRFCPREGTMWAAVLFNDGLDVWEIETMELINQLRPKLFKVNSLDWVSATHLALGCLDGLVRIYDCRNFYSCSSLLNKDTLQDGTYNPYLLTSEAALKLKSSLLLAVDKSFVAAKSLDCSDKLASAWYARQRLSDNHFLVSRSPSSLGNLSTVDRCLVTAVVMGDESDYCFWKAFMNGLTSTASLLRELLSQSESMFFLPKESFKLAYLGIIDACLSDPSNTGTDNSRQCVRDLVSVCESGRAVEYLLSLDPTEERYYLDCLKASLLTALHGNASEAVQSTIKLVATNLIASNLLMPNGIELLCMIGKIVDACRYLQSSGNFIDASVLAKMCLGPTESKEIYMKWVDHLCGPEVNQKSFALLICLYSGNLDRVLELMATSRQFERAALFLRACDENELLTAAFLERNAAICDAVYLEYARYLYSVGLREEALIYCDKGGKNGRLLKQEFQILNHDIPDSDLLTNSPKPV